MKIEIIQGSPIIQKVAGKPCKECEQDKAQKTLQKEILAGSDTVTLSGESPLKTGTASGSAQKGLDNNGKKENSGAASQAGPRTETELSTEEKQALDDLKARDREVRAHEQAHLAAAGPYAKGSPSFEFQTGPDGKPYAVGGEVQIDTSKVAGDPQATLVKAQTIKRAANAPRDPSAQDRQVAVQAAQMEAEARQEIKKERTEKQEQTSGTEQSNPAGSANATTTFVQNTPSAFPNAQPGQGINPSGNSGSNPKVQNLLQNFASSSTANKGNLLDIVS